MIAMFAFCGYARRPKIKRHAKTQCGHGHNQNDAARRGPLSHCGPHISSEEFEDEISRIGPMRAEGPRFFHKAPLYLWTFSIRQGLGIVASSNADQNWRQWPFATTRVRTRRHTTLLSERGAFTDGICDASLSLESQADSLPDGQDYKPVQKHFVNIFSAQAHGRFNSRPIKPEISAKIVVSAGEELLDGGELADTGAEPFGGDGGSEQHDRGENDDEGEPGAARGFGCRRGGKERADGESHDNPSDVGGVADAGDGRAEDQIVSDEGTE